MNIGTTMGIYIYIYIYMGIFIKLVMLKLTFG